MYGRTVIPVGQPTSRSRWARPAQVTFVAGTMMMAFLCCASHAVWAESPSQFIIDRADRTIVIEPFAPDIVRITLSVDKEAALAKPGYGIIGSPSAVGWTREKDGNGDDVIRSSQMTVRVGHDGGRPPHAMPLDDLNMQLRQHYFYGGADKGQYDDSILVNAGNDKPLLHLWHWSMEPTAKTAQSPSDDAGHRIRATFTAPSDEHYYGLGQHQQGDLDLRDHRVSCAHDYYAVGGETVCVPFMLSSRGYGLIWDNPSKTVADLAFNQQTQWSSEIGDRVSFFVIAGDKSDDIYAGYRRLTGVTHLLPKAAYGYIQSKAIYPTQEQIMAVAQGYRTRDLPLDILVVDFLNMTRQGEMDLDPLRWPDPKAMNQQLHAMGIRTLLSVWPHFSEGTRFYDMLRQKGWLIHKPDGTPDRGGYSQEIGPNIDTTNPDAAHWWWAAIRDRYLKPYDFDYIWLDETEPDVDPETDRFFVGSGARYYNVYPLFHSGSIYDGSRSDLGASKRVMTLDRAAYLGAQRNGTVFWSSDIVASWDMLKRSVPAGLNFTASGMPYWDTDIGGFFSPKIIDGYHAEHPPLINADGASAMVDGYEDYPELFVRWFEWGSFQPVMRVHGEREQNEVWSYGKEAEPILEKYLRLRYQLLPYIYSSAYHSYETGAPYMRALFMDFPNDPAVADLRDEYMFGPAILVAPVTAQGATSRKVYLPAGTDWYNYWTNERLPGGQTIEADAPIDTLPLFVRAGSILPLGSAILSTAQPQSIASLRIFPGANGDFDLYRDDGASYAYEQGARALTHLHWDDASHSLQHRGAAAWSDTDAPKIDIVAP